MTAFERQWEDYTELVELKLKKYLADGRIHKTLSEAMAYSLNAGGKRLRPALLMAACELSDGDLGDALPLAAAVEMIHTYSLIHDDLPAMDDDDYRRGKPSNHKVFGEGIAILAGDGLLNYAFQVMLEFLPYARDRDDYAKAVLELSNRAGVWGMIAGQTADLLFAAGSGEPTVAELNYIHNHKTADLISGALLAGALVAGADQRLLEALRTYGSFFGLAFQIKDDLLDLQGDASLLGKSVGKDQRENKLTFPALYGEEKAAAMLQECTENARAALEPFGEGAEFLCEMAARMAVRDH